MTNKIHLEAIKFIFVGIVNTVLGITLIFMFYNILHLGYWGASVMAYLLGGIFSFFANGKFTFGKSALKKKFAARFGLNLMICYIIAYIIAKPLTIYVLTAYLGIALDTATIDILAMLIGMVIYTFLNFVGQKFWCFNDKERS